MASGHPTPEFTTPNSEQYTKTVWATGDIVTSEKLNNIENALSGLLPLFLHVNPETAALDHTWNEIHEALASRMVVLCIDQTDEGSFRGQIRITSLQSEGTPPYIIAFADDNNYGFQCSDPDDYPVYFEQV